MARRQGRRIKPVEVGPAGHLGRVRLRHRQDHESDDGTSSSAYAPYGYDSGTSMASPMIAGSVAELAALDGNLNALQLRGLVCGGTEEVTPTYDSAGTRKQDRLGWPLHLRRRARRLQGQCEYLVDHHLGQPGDGAWLQPRRRDASTSTARRPP
jgi:hypothetical protein